jgi:uracil-DNA glycosylase family 4
VPATITQRKRYIPRGLPVVVDPNVVRGPDTSPGCGECPLARNGRPDRPVAGEGPKRPMFIALGEGPGRTEQMTGKPFPFCGPSGKLFERALKANGITREQIWIGNSTLCLPPFEKSDDMLKKARECCAPRLKQELAMFPGLPVLTLGAVGAQAMLGDKFKLGQIVSSLHDVDVDGTGLRPVIPTHHPARILRGGDGKSTSARAVDTLFLNIIYDVGKVKALAEGKNIRFSDDTEIETESPEKAFHLIERIAAEIESVGEAALDVETDSEDAVTTGLTAIAVGTVNWAASVAYPLLGANTVWGRKSWAILRRLFANPKIRWVLQNRIFDELVNGRYGAPLAGPVDDIMLKHHAAFPGASHKLQDEATQFLAVQPWKAEFRAGRDEKGRPDTIENLCKYNSRDALITARLNAPLDRCVEATGTRKVYEVDNALTVIARRMQLVGIPIQRRRNQELHVGFQEVIKRTRAQIEAPTRDEEFRKKFCDQLAVITARKGRKNDPPDFLLRQAIRMDEFYNGVRKKKLPGFVKGKGPLQFNIGNDTHIAAYLMAKGYRMPVVTAKTGKPSTAKGVLESLTQIPEVRTILEFREARKLDSTFVAKLPLIGDGEWLRCHPSWGVHLVTGRWRSSPNFQNHPKQTMKGRPSIRGQVVARIGKLLVGADFAQIEARVNGWLSGDPFLLAIFMDNYGKCSAGCDPTQEPKKYCPMHDIHTVFAVEVFANFLSMDAATKSELRDIVKRGEYGGFYGGEVETLYKAIVLLYPHVTLPEVARIVQIITSKMQRFLAWHNELIREAMQMGEIRSAILGRRRTFPLGNAEPNVVYNFPIQSTSADIVDLGILRMRDMLRDRLPGVYAELLVQGHDSVLLEVDENAADDVADIVTEALSQTHEYQGNNMIFPAKATVAENWKRIDSGVPDKQVEALIDGFRKLTRDPNRMRQAMRLFADRHVDPDSATSTKLVDDRVVYAPRMDVIKAFLERSARLPIELPKHTAWRQVEPFIDKDTI